MIADVFMLTLLGSAPWRKVVTETNFGTLIPDMLVALFTGIVVGLILLVVQIWLRHRELLDEWDFARGLLLDRVSSLSFMPDPLELGALGPIADFPSYADRFPIGRWLRNLKKPVLSDLSEFVRLLINMEPLGTHLSRSFEGYAKARGYSNDVRAIAGAVALDWTDAEILATFRIPAGVYPSLRSDAETMLVRFADDVEAFRARRGECLRLLAVLRLSLRELSR